MLMMVKDPMFVRKLRKLEKFTEDDFKRISLKDPSNISFHIMDEGKEGFGFDRK